MHVFLTIWKDANVLVIFFVGRLDPSFGSLHHGMESFGSVCRIEHMLFGGPSWINREVWLCMCLDVFRVGWLSSSSALQWFGVSAGFLLERQGQPCIGFGDVSCTRRKH